MTGIGSMLSPLLMIGIFTAFMYFLVILPQKKQAKILKNMLKSMKVGDAVITNNGFYGKVVYIKDDDCIVEFGDNKNCRIPMKKTSIVEIEKNN